MGWEGMGEHKFDFRENTEANGIERRVEIKVGCGPRFEV